MTVEHRRVTVRVDEGLLRIGSDVYPLRHVVHMGQRFRAELDYSEARKAIDRRMVIVAVAGVLLSFVTFGVALVLAAIYLLVLYSRKKQLVDIPALHALSLSTSGFHQATVWSTVKREIDRLDERLCEALRRPDSAQFTYVIQYGVSNEFVQQLGPGSVGKAQHSGTGDIVASG